MNININMENNSQCNVKCIPYKEIVKQKAIEYHKNKEKVKERNKNKYNSLSLKEKKKRQEYTKEWFKKQSTERQQELKEIMRINGGCKIK